MKYCEILVSGDGIYYVEGKKYYLESTRVSKSWKKILFLIRKMGMIMICSMWI